MVKHIRTWHLLALAAVGTLAAVAIITSIPAGQTAPEPTPDPLTVAMALCIHAHPAVDQYASDDGTSRTVQTAEQACERWLDKVGDPAFTAQWTPEYADAYRLAFRTEDTK